MLSKVKKQMKLKWSVIIFFFSNILRSRCNNFKSVAFQLHWYELIKSLICTLVDLNSFVFNKQYKVFIKFIATFEKRNRLVWQVSKVICQNIWIRTAAPSMIGKSKLTFSSSSSSILISVTSPSSNLYQRNSPSESLFLIKL